MFVGLLFVTVICYAAGGVIMNHRAAGGGPPPSDLRLMLKLLPHRQFWNGVHGLVLDGLRYSMARMRGTKTVSGANCHSHDHPQPKALRIKSSQIASAPCESAPNKRESLKKSKRTAQKNDQGQRRQDENERDDLTRSLDPDSVKEMVQSSSRVAGTPASGGGRWIHVPT